MIVKIVKLTIGAYGVVAMMCYSLLTLLQCYFHKRTDLIATNVEPSALESYDSHMEQLTEKTERFEKQKNRLQVVQLNKILFPKLGWLQQAFFFSPRINGLVQLVIKKKETKRQ